MIQIEKREDEIEQLLLQAIFLEWLHSSAKLLLGLANKQWLVGKDSAADLEWPIVTAELQEDKGHFPRCLQNSSQCLSGRTADMRVPLKMEKNVAITSWEITNSDYYQSIANKFGAEWSTVMTVWIPTPCALTNRRTVPQVHVEAWDMTSIRAFYLAWPGIKKMRTQVHARFKQGGDICWRWHKNNRGHARKQADPGEKLCSMG